MGSQLTRRGFTGLAMMTALAPAGLAGSPADIFTGPVRSSHRGTFGGKTLRYTATVESTLIKDKAGRDALSVVTTSYEVPGRDRPVIFFFNGGPIVASLYLHLGLFAPRTICFPNDLKAPFADAVMADNPNSPLEMADLVAIDPAGTGLSRPLPGVDLKEWANVEADADQFAQLVRAWLKLRGRQNSPVYIMGESYGTVRAPKLVEKLATGDQPVRLGGVILIGQAANIADYVQRPTNIISYVVSLPTLAATAWYHNAVDRKGHSLEEFVSEARRFADTAYLEALYRGADLPDEQTKAVAEVLAGFTGVPSSYFVSHRLRLTKEGFRPLLFKEKGLIVGMTDTRYVGPVKDKDPARGLSDTLEKAYPAYLRDFLKVDTAMTYIPMADFGKDFEGWDYGSKMGPFGDWPFYASISKALEKQPKMQIMVGGGYYDTQTSIGAAEYLLKQAGWPKQNTRLAYYEGGHMCYSNPSAQAKLCNDLRDLLRSAG